MSIAETRKGHKLLAFETDGAVTPPAGITIPVPFALVVAIHQEKVLFVYNDWREIWELPGGLIDEGESATVAAKRELQEETAQIAQSLTPIGLAKMQLKPDDRLEFGAIFKTHLTDIRDFENNDEASETQWLDVTASRPADVNAIDFKIAKIVFQQTD